MPLSKRGCAIESIINKEIREINYNINKSISLFEERKINKGVARQQFVMTSVNNLALLLSENPQASKWTWLTVHLKLNNVINLEVPQSIIERVKKYARKT